MTTTANAPATSQPEGRRNHAAFIWSVADLLRGDYKQSEYGKVILPLTVIRRLDCVLEPTKEAVLERQNQLAGRIAKQEPVLQAAAGQQFFNTSQLTFTKLLDDPDNIAESLAVYIGGFSEAARDIVDKFAFDVQVERMRRANILYQVIGKFAEIDLHPDVLSNIEMGHLYEELVRKFSELSNETAGEHFTPREVIRLMVNLLFIDDEDILTKRGIVKTLCDPACGTGGMLSVAEDHLRALNPQARLEVFGQELNAETYAICRSDMLIKGQDASHIAYGNSFSEDHHAGGRFDYLLANPPFGVDWKKVKSDITREADTQGFQGRFGAGLPRINDGSFLFLQHMMSKMKPPDEGGSRVAIVFNGSPLFSGVAGSGESEIRRWIIENDWLEAVVALPDQLFYNTSIATYFWIVTNRKSSARQGKVMLVDARTDFVKRRKPLGEKRKEISDTQIDAITRKYGNFRDGSQTRVIPNWAFGYQRIAVERPLRLRYEFTEDTLLQVRETKPWASLAGPKQREIASTLSKLVGTATDRRKDIASQLAELPRDIEREVWKAIGVRDASAPVVTARKDVPKADAGLRESQNLPLPAVYEAYGTDPADRLSQPEYREIVDQFMRNHVLPHTGDAWVDHAKTKLGYEIPFALRFYKYKPPRALDVIKEEIAAQQARLIASMDSEDREE